MTDTNHDQTKKSPVHTHWLNPVFMG